MLIDIISVIYDNLLTNFDALVRLYSRYSYRDGDLLTRRTPDTAVDMGE